MNFGDALERLKTGAKIYRAGWYGKHHLVLHEPSADEPSTQSYIVIVTQSGAVVPWLASQADVLAEDWGVDTVGLQIEDLRRRLDQRILELEERQRVDFEKPEIHDLIRRLDRACLLRTKLCDGSLHAELTPYFNRDGLFVATEACPNRDALLDRLLAKIYKG